MKLAFPTALSAHTVNLYRVTLHLEALGQRTAIRESIKLFVVDVLDTAALGTDQVMVRTGIRVNAKGSVMQTDLVHDLGGDERVNSLVNRRERHRGNLPMYAFVNLFGARMPIHGHQRLVDHGSLVSRRQPVLVTQLAEINVLPDSGSACAQRIRLLLPWSWLGGHTGIDEQNRKRIRV